MLDENLPTFYLRPNSQQKHLWTIYICQHGDDPEPAYTLRYPDPASPSSKNRYAVALCDPFVPDVVYGEVLIIPEWTQPSLSAEAIRLNGGVTPPPEAILPSQFIVQLYNPDQQVTIRYKHKTWNTPATWEFEMPQHTFRQPSASTLDRTQTDPALADTTPKLRFSWRKDSKLSKDLTCLLLGKTSTLPEGRTKSKEPDITVSIFKALRELTLYEPNMYRVEMEDFKGLEIVLLLGAVTIRDVYFTPMKDAFRIVRDEVGRKPVADPTGSPVNVSASPTVQSGAALQNQKPAAVAPNAKANDKQPASSRPAETQVTKPSPTPAPAQAPAPTQQQKTKKQELSRKEEEKRTKKRLEEEEKARRKRQAEIDKETRRLQKIYGREEQQVRASSVNLARPPAQPPRPPAPPRQQQPHPPPRPNARYYYHQQAPSMLHLTPGPVATPPRPHSTVHSLQPPQPQDQGQQPPKKSSFFGFRRSSDDSKVHKKRSSMF
ncbi:uncharacterized protein AFUA_2G04470 [Aspergillus fumigatus Af293]|uniref:Uncharacterized protein n=1 Tax=Aspergillus fumigatus (strain ATCC MYA-4609 / CBS 101355 / FGSC A1100 / Af293) TaxID=330879 RepID=Q4WHR5_ASPFU|nr:conserved hypothetical protein [Aspergillus fumigatus Af293]EAL87540.1 conserved hypothetical protein [Aspergillus fumigatus Af293]